MKKNSFKKNTYTRRELKILKAKEPIDINDKEYLILFAKATRVGDVKAVEVLLDVYVEMFETTHDEKYINIYTDPVEKEDRYDYPILLETNKYTEKRIKNIITYLTGHIDIECHYIRLLHSSVKYKEVCNYFTGEYYRDYDKKSLWEDYFLKISELEKIIKLRSIESFDELIKKTISYFEQFALIEDENLDI